MERALILTEGYLDSYIAKTAHGLLRYSRRYEVLGVVDSKFSKTTTDKVIPNCNKKPIFETLEKALTELGRVDILIVGVATIGGYLPEVFRENLRVAIENNIDIVAGLHKYLNDDEELSKLANEHGVKLYDIRRSPPMEDLHYFADKKKDIGALTVPFLGTDSSIGKRTALISVYEYMKGDGVDVEWVATGQTGLLQGAAHGLPLDSIKGDYMVGELEHNIWLTWKECKPDVILIEGQGSISHPAYVCGARAVLAASQPDGIVMIHAPARKYRHYKEDEIQWPMPNIETERIMTKLYSHSPVIAIGINPENIPLEERKKVIDGLESKHGIPCSNALEEPEKIVSAIVELMDER
ncbi:MAG: DUF1611 domain-containing protein [Thermoplasmata archaeon]